jgi:hypothetical protein
VSGARRVTLRPYEDGDLEGTLLLRPRLYPGWREASDAEWHRSVFEWLARSPAEAPMHRWVLDDGGEIVGHLAAVPLPYRIGGERIVAHTPTDYMALPGYGFHAVALMRTFFATCPSYVACNVAGEVSRIEGLFRPTRVAPLVHGLNALDVAAYPRLPRRVPRLAAVAASTALRAVDAVLLAASRGGVEVMDEPAATFDDRFDRLRERVAAAIPCTVEKSSRFLTWRYGPGTPREPIRLLTVTDSSGLAGYAVLRTTSHDEGFILDLTTLPERPGVARALLAAAVRRFWADHAFVIRYRFLPSPVSPGARDLRRLGFVIRGAGARGQGAGDRGARDVPGIGPERQLELLVKLADPTAQALAGEASRWTYNQGDGEASFWVH